jgi:hypothetical protein
VIAVYLLIANLLGYSAGPILVASLTDEVFRDPAAINASLAIAGPSIMATGIALLAFALKPFRSMLADPAPTEN